MSSDLDNLYKLTNKDAKRASEVLAKAFSDDPVWNTFMENDPKKDTKFPLIFETPVRYALKYGEVYATSQNLEGIAAWLPHDKAKMTAWGILRSGAFRSAIRLGSKLASKMDSVFSVLDEDREENLQAPYFYLSVISVGPEFQGQGFGGLLIKKLLQQADEAGYPIYLETETENNVLMYEKFRFKVVKKIELPNLNLPMWEMIRNPSS